MPGILDNFHTKGLRSIGHAFIFRFLSKFVFSSILILLPVLFFSNAVYTFEFEEQIRIADSEKKLKEAKNLARKGKLVDAKSILDELLEEEPDNWQAKIELAAIYIKSRDLVTAYKYAEEVLEDHPSNGFALGIIGTAYLNAGNFKEAKRYLVAAIVENKKQPLAWASVGLLDFYENRFDESILNLKEAIRYDPREPNYAFSLGQVLSRAERYGESAKAFERYLYITRGSNPERTERIKGLIKFLRYLGRKRKLFDLRGAKETELDISIVNNRPVVPVRLKKNGEVLNFVIDTGSGVSVVSKKTANRLKIKPVSEGGLARALGGNGKFNIVYGFLREIRVGEVGIRNVPIYIREFHNKDENIDGYIGLSLISKYLTTIDYGEKKLNLKRMERGSSKGKSQIEDNGNSIPLRLTSSGFLSGEVQLEGMELPLNFIVDTGASVSVIDTKLVDSKHIAPYKLERTLRVIGAAGITENVSSFKLPRIYVGRFSMEDVMAVALDLDIINEAAGFEQGGILGGNFFKDYRLTFDFKRSKVTFEKHGR